ncbi:rhomboid family intramembrane serine protease [bacterium]|nr:rhomboid family intramembrane serine protease [bacterium]
MESSLAGSDLAGLQTRVNPLAAGLLPRVNSDVMLFFLFPCGMNLRLSKRGLFSYVLLALILYRLIAATIYPAQLSVLITQMLPPEAWNVEFWSAILQSLFTPVTQLPPPLQISSSYPTSVSLIMLFWLIFGPALEDRLGREGFVLFYLGGALISAICCSLPFMGDVPIFWLGHGAALFMIGVCYHQFLTDEVKLFYLFFLWIPWTNKSGIAHISSLFVLTPIHIMAALALSPIWYIQRDEMSGAAIGAGIWAFLLPFVGTGVSWVYDRLRRKMIPQEEAQVMG